jgi:hypothetical protein
MIDFDEIEERVGDDEFLEFDRIPPDRKLSSRPDVHAFILLDRLVPGKSDLICSSEHDEFYFDVSAEDLNKVATEEDAIDLIRCGVRCGEYGLCMFA